MQKRLKPGRPFLAFILRYFTETYAATYGAFLNSTTGRPTLYLFTGPFMGVTRLFGIGAPFRPTRLLQRHQYFKMRCTRNASSLPPHPTAHPAPPTTTSHHQRPHHQPAHPMVGGIRPYSNKRLAGGAIHSDRWVDTEGKSACEPI